MSDETGRKMETAEDRADGFTASTSPLPQRSDLNLARSTKEESARFEVEYLKKPLSTHAGLEVEYLKEPLLTKADDIHETDMPDCEISYRYKMDHKYRGYAIVINNQKFHQSTGMDDRPGSEKDVKSLKEVLKPLGFKVKVYKNQSKSEMLDLMQKQSEENHYVADCLLVVFLSHGDTGLIYAADGTVYIDDLIEPFKHSASLVGKPKLFFFQACQGAKLDHGIKIKALEGEQRPQRIPVESDFLLAFATVSGYFSWRNIYGSWFIQSLCHVLKQWGSSLEIMQLMARVCHKVAYDYQTKSAHTNMSGKKQSPQIISTLTKELYFH